MLPPGSLSHLARHFLILFIHMDSFQKFWSIQGWTVMYSNFYYLFPTRCVIHFEMIERRNEPNLLLFTSIQLRGPSSSSLHHFIPSGFPSPWISRAIDILPCAPYIAFLSRDGDVPAASSEHVIHGNSDVNIFFFFENAVMGGKT